MPEPSALHPVNRQHLEALTDDVGIMQHAVGSRPDPAHGYCTDDVARALQVDLLHQRELGWPAVATSAWRSLRFLADAFDATTGRFRNFRSVDRSWLSGTASEDSQGRAMLALGDVIAESPDAPMVAAATTLFERALPGAHGLSALRAQASVVLGCAATVTLAPDSAAVDSFRDLAERFSARFQRPQDRAWPWPEPSLTYENALPVRALLVAGRALGSDEMTDTGLAVLDWQLDAQTATDGHLSPIGNGWWPRGGAKSRFDQQPIEATALLLAAESAYQTTTDDRYRMAMEQAYAWFLGRNDLGRNVADPLRGAGFDGLTEHGINTNQGAESTLMWLAALEHVRMSRHSRPAGADMSDTVLVGSIA